ncbi:MAG: archaetidylserine decarboxylase [Pseudomonadota bacterium]|nr:archaetidylserine decarboxylase [Pseudomonadota bacterium]
MTARSPIAAKSLLTARSLIARIVQQEDLNFLFTNRIPRRLLTRFMGWLSRVEHPWVCAGGIGLWRLFTDLDLSDAKHSRFKSLHDCFTRELKDGARPLDADPDRLVSPCDALVGACGEVTQGTVLQAKGFPYLLSDLLVEGEIAKYYQGGQYVTLRLTSSMYHRFHAPADCRVEQVTYVSGDTWNVNPIALKRVEKLFCKNERAIIRCRLAGVAQERALPAAPGALITLVPVAAILVASIRLRFLDVLLHLRYRGPNVIRCNAELHRGEEMGWFEHGSTILVFMPRGMLLCEQVREGGRVRMGQALARIA